MKGLFIAIFFCSAFIAKAQTQVVNLNQKEINVYGKDSRTIIGKVIVNSALSTKLFLLKSTQKKDTANNYITTFYLGNKEKIPLASVKILMKFSKPVMDVTPGTFVAAFNTVKGFSDDRLQYLFKARPLNRDPGSVIVISFTIKSKDRIITEISGLDGVLP